MIGCDAIVAAQVRYCRLQPGRTFVAEHALYAHGGVREQPQLAVPGGLRPAITTAVGEGSGQL